MKLIRNLFNSFVHKIRSTASYYRKEGILEFFADILYGLEDLMTGKYKDTTTVKVLKELPIVMGFIVIGYYSVIEIDWILHNWTNKEIVRSFLIVNAMPVYGYFIRLYIQHLIDDESD
jgi:hypothetical protein